MKIILLVPYQRECAELRVQTRPSADYLLACRGRLAAIGDVTHPQLSAEFLFTSDQLGYPLVIARRQWSALLQVAALTGTGPTRLSAEYIKQALTEFRAAADRRGLNRSRNLSGEVFGMQAVLFHLGLLDRLPARSNGQDGRRAADWARIAERAPVIAATMTDYLDQLSVRLRPNSLRTIDTSLRLFAGYLLEQHPDVTAIAGVRRSHVQGYKSWLAARHGHRGPVLANQTLRGRLGTLAVFFGRLDELDITDAPARSPIHRADLPIKDDPLPRFIDDAASAKLHAAAQAHPDLFTRVAIELLARTGLRKSELLGLTVDAVVQIGSSYWLRIPVGKLHTDRYVPLHPQLKTLLAPVAHPPGRYRPIESAVSRAGPADQRIPAGHRTRGMRGRRRDRTCHRPPTQAHARHPGHQSWDEPRGDSCSAGP